jgi:hypothetical protein
MYISILNRLAETTCSPTQTSGSAQLPRDKAECRMDSSSTNKKQSGIRRMAPHSSLAGNYAGCDGSKWSARKWLERPQDTQAALFAHYEDIHPSTEDSITISIACQGTDVKGNGTSQYGCCKVVPDAGTAHCERAERLKQSPYAILGFASPPLAARKDGIELLYPRSRICQATLLQP